jgi:hypothetical protein
MKTSHRISLQSDETENFSSITAVRNRKEQTVVCIYLCVLTKHVFTDSQCSGPYANISIIWQLVTVKPAGMKALNLGVFIHVFKYIIITL